ncbi:MAG: BLUF domain-containing protein [Mycobacteriales bacterium]
MRSVVYASRALAPFDDDELLHLLETARARNDEHGVTGMLVYAAGSFLQLFEGEDDAVEVIWDRIRLDPRHTGLRVLQDGPVRGRLFGEWSMGFEHPDHQRLEETLPGYRAGSVYPFVDSQLVDTADTASTLLELYARRAD